MEKQNKELSFEEFTALIERTDKEKPKPEDMTKMRKYLNQGSSLVKMNECSEIALKKMILAFSNSALMRELLERQVKEKREAFGYETASIIERMLIDQVILCWHRLNHIEATHSAKLELSGSHSHASGLYWDKRLSSAQRRLLKAGETLTKVQKHLAEANLRELQAQNKRAQSAVLAKNLLKDLTN